LVCIEKHSTIGINFPGDATQPTRENTAKNVAPLLTAPVR